MNERPIWPEDFAEFSATVGRAVKSHRLELTEICSLKRRIRTVLQKGARQTGSKICPDRGGKPCFGRAGARRFAHQPQSKR
jgi:hypothetical protein